MVRWIVWGIVGFGVFLGWPPCSLLSTAAADGPNGAGAAAVERNRAGFQLAPGIVVELPGELLPRTGPVSAAALEELTGRHRWDRFAADSRLAPVAVTIKPVMGQGSRVGHQVRAAFTLRTCISDQFDRRDDSGTSGLGPIDAGGTVRVLTAEELAQAGVSPAADGNERFILLELRLLNRINVRGVVRIQRRVTPDSIEVVWSFDHRFDSLPDLATTATRLGSNELGERVSGSLEPYAGAGGIVTARELSESDAAAPGQPVVIVESRLVFSEPESWFGGSNLLRAKIPLITQEGVRTLRRRLEAAAHP